jgi:HK97 family phage portal protein
MMGIVARMARPEAIRNLSLTDEKAWNPSLWNLIGSQSLSGETVTESTAMTYSAVWNAVELISGTIASLPLDLMQGRGKSKRIADDYKLYHVMHSQWNPLMTAKKGRECIIAHVLTWGNGYAEKVRNGYGEIVELWPIAPNRVTPKMQDGAIVYDIKMESAAPITLPREKVLHLIGPSFDGLTGYSRIAMARKSIGLGMAMESFGSLYFGKGTHPSAVLTHPNVIKDPKVFREAVSEVYAGLGQSHQLMVLEDGMKIEKVGIPPEDSQFLESRQFQIPEIARWFNLPPHKLKDLSRSSFNNIESEQRSFYSDTLLPSLVDLEQAYEMQLLTPADRSLSGRGHLYFKHNAAGILRADAAGRGAFYRALWGIGGITINQVKELEDLPPDGNPLADQPFVPLNMVPLSMLVEKLRKELEKPVPAVPVLPPPED